MAEVLIQGVLDERVGEAVAAGFGDLAYQRHGRGGVEHIE
jgi:hypothetical protein